MDRERQERVRQALEDLLGDAAFFYGSVAEIGDKAYPSAPKEQRTSAEHTARKRTLHNVREAIRTGLIPDYERRKTAFLRLLKGTGGEGTSHQWIICIKPEFRTNPHLPKASEKGDWFSRIGEIAAAISVVQEKYKSKYIELFETYMLLYMRDRGPKAFRKAARLRWERILESPNWFPEYQDAPWKKHRREIVRRLEDNEYLVHIAVDPKDAWRRLQDVHGEATDDSPILYTQQGDFIEELARAPQEPYREDVLELIEAFVRRSSTKRLFSLSGAPGTGKTTLVASYLARELRHGREHPCFFVRMDRHKPAMVLAILATKVRPMIVNRPGFCLAQPDAEPVSLLEEALHSVAGRRRVVMFIDGLDETELSPSGKSLSALLGEVKIPKHVKMVLSGRPTESFRRLLETHGCNQFDVVLEASELQDAALRGYYEEHLGLEVVRTIRLDRLVHKTEGSFLYAELVVPEIRTAFADNGFYDVRKAPRGLADALQREWRRLLRGPLSRSQLTRLLGCIAVYRGWPTLEELAELSGLDFPDVEAFFDIHEHLFVLKSAVSSTLDPSVRVLSFCHSEIRRFLVDNKILPAGMRRAHTRILDHYYQGGKPGWQTRVNEYALQHLVAHAAGVPPVNWSM